MADTQQPSVPVDPEETMKHIEVPALLDMLTYSLAQPEFVARGLEELATKQKPASAPRARLAQVDGRIWVYMTHGEG